MAKPTYKLLMTWDIRPGKESEYFEYAVQEFVPKLTRLGVQPTEAWYTVWGNAPQILTGFVAEERSTIESLIDSDEWAAIMDRMQTYVNNFTYRVVPAVGLFQL